MKLDITLLIDNLGSGGAQRQLVLLAHELVKKGCKVTLITYNKNEHMAYMLENVEIKRIKVDTEGSGKIGKFLSVLKVLLKEKPKVIISYLDNPNIMSALYTSFNREVVWIPSERNLNSGKGNEVLWRKLAYKFAHKVVSNSYAQEKWLLSQDIISKNKSKVVWNAVHNDFFSTCKESIKGGASNNFLILGRLSYQKNPELLLDAVQKLTQMQEIPSVEFNWFGDDDPDSPGKRVALTEKIRKLSLPIIIHEPSKSSHKLLEQTDCLILTSRYEGTPNVVLEAMAAGTFVIAPYIVDLPVIIGNNKRGILFEKNSPSSLVNAINTFIKLPVEDKQYICNEAKEYAKLNFNGDNLASKYIEVINNV